MKELDLKVANDLKYFFRFIVENPEQKKAIEDFPNGASFQNLCLYLTFI